jgi:2-iminobutanoate/2-iminopropanoate deaminase
MEEIMRETIVLPNHPPKYPYFSDIVKARGTFLFLSGQLGCRADGSWGKNFGEQLELALENLQAALHAAGGTVEDVVQLVASVSDVRVGDADHRHGNEFNEIYSRVFKTNWPVRTRVQAAMMDPQCMVELDAIAVVDPASLT